MCRKLAWILRIGECECGCLGTHPYESAEALCRRRNKVSTQWQVVRADSRWYGPAMMSNGRDGNFKCILMDTYESVEALRCCIRLRIFISRFEMTLLHPYETAEALCRRRNKVSTAAEWLVI